MTQKSQNPVNDNNRIAKNTLLLYVRQLVALFVGLYTVRIVLNVLGVEDFGLYNVVAGIVTMLTFLTGTMTSATQRFFSFAIGENDNEKLNKIFSTNLIIYFGIAVFTAIFLETVGLWYVKNRLQVPLIRLESIIIVYHCAVLSFMASVFSAPFTAIIVAYEDMKYFAYFAIVDSILRLGVVYLLTVLAHDKLELYGFLNLVVSLFILIMYFLVCALKYKDLKIFSFYWDKTLLKEVVNFTGWTLLGRLSTVSRNQAITILLNQVFSPITVAARAISISITTKINMFSSSFNTGLYPPIIKAYASGEKERMFDLIFNGSKITFFLMWILALPIFLEMDLILNLWLKKVPQDTVLFTRLAIIESLITSISMPLATAARAPGKMKNYELILGGLQMLIFFLSWLLVNFGYDAYIVYVVAIVINLIMFYVRLYLVSGLIGLQTKLYIREVVKPLLLVAILTSLLIFSTKLVFPKSLIYSLINMSLCIIISSILMFYIGLDKKSRLKYGTLILNKFK